MPDKRDIEAQELKRQAGEHERQGQELRREANERVADNSRVRGEEHRVEGETGRDDAEGGRDTAEGGRVTAEEGRVTAEEDRVSEAHQPVWVPRTKRSAVYAAVALFIVAALFAGVPAFLVADHQSQADDNEAMQRRTEACERGKADRIDNARAWTQTVTTWFGRAADRSVTPSERKRAALAATRYQETANGLRRRLFLCGPLMESGREVIDRPALLEALGKP